MNYALAKFEFISIMSIFMLLLFFIYISINKIRMNFVNVRNRVWYFLLIILILSLFLRLYYPVPHTRIFYDEPVYMNTAKSALTHGAILRCSFDVKGEEVCSLSGNTNTLPFSFSIPFLLFGIKPSIAFYTNLFFSVFTIFILFLFVYLLFNEKTALLVSLLFALYPAHILWSVTAYSHIITLFFYVLTLLFFLLYFKTNSFKLFIVSLLSLFMAAQTRPESFLFISTVFVFYILYKRNISKNIHRDILTSLPFLLLIVFNSNSVKDWVLRHILLEGEVVVGKNPFVFHVYPPFSNIVFLIPLFFGLFFMFKRNRKALFFFLFNFIVFHPLYNSYIHYNDPRLYLISGLSLVILMSYGLVYLIKTISTLFSASIVKIGIEILLFTLFILLIFYNGMPYLEMMPYNINDRRFFINTIDEKIASDWDFSCYIITTNTRFVNPKIKEMRLLYVLDGISELLTLKEKNCILYFYDQIENYGSREEKEEHETFKKIFDLIPYKSYSLETKSKLNFTFYNFYLKNETNQIVY